MNRDGCYDAFVASCEVNREPRARHIAADLHDAMHPDRVGSGQIQFDRQASKFSGDVSVGVRVGDRPGQRFGQRWQR